MADELGRLAIPAPVPVDATLTEDERASLSLCPGCGHVTDQHSGPHGPGCLTYPPPGRDQCPCALIERDAEHAAVERILAQRAAPDPRIEKVRALADEWEAAAQKPMPERAPTETAQDQGVRIGVWHSVRKAASELRAVLDGDPTAPDPVRSAARTAVDHWNGRGEGEWDGAGAVMFDLERALEARP